MMNSGFLLVTGRTIYQGVGKEYGKLSREYFNSVAICEIDSDDMDELGIIEGMNVKISTDYGTVVLKAVESLRAPHPKILYVPYGPWANLVISNKTNGTGMASFKGIPAAIEASSEKVLEVVELLKKYYGKA